MYGDDAEAHAVELAHRFAEAQTSTGPGKPVRYSLLAGEQALDSYAYEDALTHFERGLVARNIVLSGAEAASDDEAASLQFGVPRRVRKLGDSSDRSSQRTTSSPLPPCPSPSRIELLYGRCRSEGSPLPKAVDPYPTSRILSPCSGRPSPRLD